MLSYLSFELVLLFAIIIFNEYHNDQLYYILINDDYWMAPFISRLLTEKRVFLISLNYVCYRLKVRLIRFPSCRILHSIK